MVALFVLLMFILFIVIDIFVLKAQKKTHPAFEVEPQFTSSSVFTKNTIVTPEGFYFSQGHTWAKEDEYGMVKVGVDDFILKALGKFKYHQTAAPGSKIKKGDVIFEGGRGKDTFKFRSPVDGIVRMANSSVIGINLTEPYENSWGILVEPNNFATNKASLISGSKISEWMKEEFNRFKEFLNVHTMKPELAGLTMQDGGNIVEGAISSINTEGLKDFEKEFLSF